ncbi:MAG TPA: aminopeptidase P family protein [Gemmatimonadales bacterium]|nr:aminopeptidase P family protein [Gemmatimonadales bacterium]
MPDRRPARIDALLARLDDEGLDALVVSHPANIRYLTGFSGSAGLLLACRQGVLFITDFRYDAQSRAEIGALARIVIDGTGSWERLLKLLPEYPLVHSVGYEGQVVTVHEAERLSCEGAAAWRFQPTSDVVEGLRIAKAPEEVEAVRAAGAVATAALAEATAAVRPGQTELEIAALLESALRRHGSEDHPFPTIVASGPRSALPHARTTGRRAERGELLLLDFGAVVDGYASDVTRTFVVGAAPTARQSEVFAVVRQAQEAALAGLRAGLTGRAADALARDVIDGAGHGSAFGHSLGHGLGLEVHEAPRLARTAEQALPEGAVVTVEPGVYYSDWGGVRIEDDVVLGEAGATLLTQFPRDLLVLG